MGSWGGRRCASGVLPTLSKWIGRATHVSFHKGKLQTSPETRAGVQEEEEAASEASPAQSTIDVGISAEAIGKLLQLQVLPPCALHVCMHVVTRADAGRNRIAESTRKPTHLCMALGRA